ncbi:MAG: DoxX family protein [Planctomycetes bacterium]|nr:DoxX family protein [Planctomycetota bacterium]
MDAKRQDLTNSIGLLVLRVGLGLYMASHGWSKFADLMQGKFNDQFDPIGIGPHLSLMGAAGSEFICALMVIVGVATRVAAAPIVFTMIVAAFVVHGSDPWTMGAGASKEPALLFAFGFLTLIFTGAGKFSVDGLLWPAYRRRRKRRKEAGKP